MISGLLIILISLPWFSSDAEEAPEPAPEPKREFRVSEIQRKVREFRLLGDQFLSGDPDAYRKRQSVSKALSEELAVQPPEVWKRPPDVEALMLFVLFGGRAEPLLKAIDSGNLPDPWKEAARAISAYAERQLDLARSHFKNVTMTDLPESLRAPLKLVQGTLLAETQPEEAKALFESVRLLEPGTALEEAAMRQQALLLLKQEKIKEATLLIANYTRRYPRSVYWQQFQTVAVQALSEAPLGDELAIVKAIDTIPTVSGADRYRDFLAEASRQILEDGHFESARKIAEATMAVSQSGSQAWHRAKLYSLVAKALFEDPSSVRQELVALDRRSYRSDEQALIDAAIKITDRIIEGYTVESVAMSLSHSEDKPKLQTERAVAQKDKPETASVALPPALKDDIQKTLETATARLAKKGD